MNSLGFAQLKTDVCIFLCHTTVAGTCHNVVFALIIGYFIVGHIHPINEFIAKLNKHFKVKDE